MKPHLYEVRVAPSARRNLNHIPLRHADALIAYIAGPVASRPHRVGKPLRGDLAGRHGARLDDYRIVYLIDDEARVVIVTRVEHRADVYRSR